MKTNGNYHRFQRVKLKKKSLMFSLFRLIKSFRLIMTNEIFDAKNENIFLE